MHVTIGSKNKVTREEKPPRTRLGILVIIPNEDIRLHAVGYLEKQLSRFLGFTPRTLTRVEDRYAVAGPQAADALRNHSWDHIVVTDYLYWRYEVREMWDLIEDARLFDKTKVHWETLR